MRQYKTEAFTRRHYELFADLINEMLLNPETYDPLTISRFENLLSAEFRKDNYGFKPERFTARAHKGLV